MGRDLTMLEKIGIGFCFALLAMVVAAILEYARKYNTPADGTYDDKDARANISSCADIDNYDPYKYQEYIAGTENDEPTNCHQISGCNNYSDGLLDLSCISCDNIPQKSRINLLWQGPQFILIGISEIFSSITSLEFFYSQAPNTMRSVSQSANLFTSALGSWLTIPLVLLVNCNPSDEWLPNDVNSGHLEDYFLLLAGLMILAIAFFIYLAMSYEYADPEILSALSEQYDQAQLLLMPSDGPETIGEGYGSGRTGSGDLSRSPLLAVDFDRNSIPATPIDE